MVKQKHNDIIDKNYPWRLLVLNNRSIHLAGIVQTNLREYAFYGEQNSCCYDLECSGNFGFDQKVLENDIYFIID